MCKIWKFIAATPVQIEIILFATVTCEYVSEENG
jgi:hypothetical protein